MTNQISPPRKYFLILNSILYAKPNLDELNDLSKSAKSHLMELCNLPINVTISPYTQMFLNFYRIEEHPFLFQNQVVTIEQLKRESIKKENLIRILPAITPEVDVTKESVPFIADGVINIPKGEENIIQSLPNNMVEAYKLHTRGPRWISGELYSKIAIYSSLLDFQEMTKKTLIEILNGISELKHNPKELLYYLTVIPNYSYVYEQTNCILSYYFGNPNYYLILLDNHSKRHAHCQIMSKSDVERLWNELPTLTLDD